MSRSLACRAIVATVLCLAFCSSAPARATSCVPDATTLCVDDQAGDRRFAIHVDFQTTLGGGFVGSGRALALSNLGVTRGGLFWFFGQDNPEIMVKVLNGCGVNNRFWVYLSAGTSVGFNLTVTDTTLGHSKSYQNPDRILATSVDDTTALSCTAQ